METTRPQSRKSLWVSGGWYLLAALPVGLGILTGALSILAAMMLSPMRWSGCCVLWQG